jgi:hypothetical protein
MMDEQGKMHGLVTVFGVLQTPSQIFLQWAGRRNALP